jgi:UDP-N-acetylmuramoyl-L-alanyl-D-glutamate--2,6-diaminopimelate ligase
MRTVHTHIRGISLRDLLPEAQFYGNTDIRVTSCCNDPDHVEQGDLFALLSPAEGAAQSELATAVRHGALAVLCEQRPPGDLPACVVPNARAAYGQICQTLAGNPSHRTRVIGVTGTNGKTTVTTLITSILRAAGKPTAAIGIPALDDTVEAPEYRFQTRTAAEFAHGLATAEMEGCSHAVVEVSSEALAEYRTAGVDFDAAVLTNVRRDHLDLHGSVRNYRSVKGRLLSQLTGEGFAVINADDPASNFYLRELENPVLTVGQKCPAELTATVVERHRSEQTVLLEAGSDLIPFRTRMVGDHHVTNCLLAAAVGLLYRVDLPTIIRGLEEVQHIPGRLERIECGQPFSVFVDYARTPDTLAAGLRALRRVTSGRVICVFGAEGDREKQQRPLLGRVAERCADVSVITGNNPGHESPLDITHDTLDGYERPARAHVIPGRERAIVWALEQAEPGDSVLIAGKGDECGQRIGDEYHPFDDRQLVRDWLYDNAAQEEVQASC